MGSFAADGDKLMITAKISDSLKESYWRNFDKFIEKEFPVASRNAATKTAQQAKDDLAKKNNIPAAIFTGRVRAWFGYRDAKVGSAVWIGTNPISTEYLPYLREAGTGAYAGDDFIDGGFIVPEGSLSLHHAAIFKRRTEKHLPIDLQEKDIDDSGEADYLALLAAEGIYQEISTGLDRYVD